MRMCAGVLVCVCINVYVYVRVFLSLSFSLFSRRLLHTFSFSFLLSVQAPIGSAGGEKALHGFTMIPKREDRGKSDAHA